MIVSANIRINFGKKALLGWGKSGSYIEDDYILNRKDIVDIPFQS